MIKGTIDRFEGSLAVVEIFIETNKEPLLFIDILAHNLPEDANEGDVLNIESITSIPVEIGDEGLSADMLALLKLLEKPSECKISVDSDATADAQARIAALAAELFED